MAGAMSEIIHYADSEITAVPAVIQSPVGRYKLARVWSRVSGVTPGGLYQNIGEPRQQSCFVSYKIVQIFKL